MTGRAGLGRTSTRPAIHGDRPDSFLILSSALMTAVIGAGFIVSLKLAEVNPMLADALSTILN